MKRGVKVGWGMKVGLKVMGCMKNSRRMKLEEGMKVKGLKVEHMKLGLKVGLKVDLKEPMRMKGSRRMNMVDMKVLQVLAGLHAMVCSLR